MECVPNFSEGRDLAKIEKIVDKFRAKAGVKLLDYSNDEDHNRLVVTVVGEPEALKDALLEAHRTGGGTDRSHETLRAASSDGSGRCRSFYPDQRVYDG